MPLDESVIWVSFCWPLILYLWGNKILFYIVKKKRHTFEGTTKLLCMFTSIGKHKIRDYQKSMLVQTFTNLRVVSDPEKMSYQNLYYLVLCVLNDIFHCESLLTLTMWKPINHSLHNVTNKTLFSGSMSKGLDKHLLFQVQLTAGDNVQFFSKVWQLYNNK